MDQRRTLGDRPRFDYLDLAKFISMLSVLMYHSHSFIESNILAYTGFRTVVNYICRGIFSTSVPLFFFVNGFLLFRAELDLKKHCRKMLRLVITAFAGGAVLLVIFRFLYGEVLSPLEFLRALWGWKFGRIHHLWFLGALVCIYVFFPLLKTAFDRSKRVFVYFIAATALLTFGNTLLCWAAAVGLDVLGRDPRIVSTNFFNMFNPYRQIYGYAFVYFCAGGAAYWQMPRLEALLASRRGTVNAAAAGTVVLSMLGLGLWGIWYSHQLGIFWDNVWYGLDSVFTFAAVAGLFVLCLNYRAAHWYGRFIRLASTHSLGIYIFHVLFIHILQVRIAAIPYMDGWIGCFLFSLANICVTMGAVLLLEKLAGWLLAVPKRLFAGRA